MAQAAATIRANIAFNGEARRRAEALVRDLGASEALAAARRAKRAAADGRSRRFAIVVERECAERAGVSSETFLACDLPPDVGDRVRSLVERGLVWMELRLQPWLGEPIPEGEDQVAAARLGVTARQLHCLRLAAAGFTSKEIARSFSPPLCWRTVEDHLARVRRRLGVETTIQAVGVAYREGLLEAPPP